jgi:arsenate reductase
MSTEKARVLFLCTHNAARSQIAEAVLRRYGGHRFEACSAGLEPTEVHPLTHEVLREADIDSTGLQAKGLQAFLGKTSVRYAIVVCEREDELCPRVLPFATHTLYWPFADPVEVAGTPEDRLMAFREIRDRITARVRRFVLEGV